MEREQRSLRGGLWGGAGGGRYGKAFGALAEMLAGAFDGEALFIQKSLDFEYEFHIFAAVLTLVSAGLLWTESIELRFPVAQHVRFHTGEAGNLTYFEIQLIRDVRRGYPNGSVYSVDAIRGVADFDWLLRLHSPHYGAV